MTFFIKFVGAAAAGVAMTACISSHALPQAERFVAGDPASLKRAEDLSLRYLREARTLMAGVELGRVRNIEIDSLGRAHIRVTQTVGGIPVFGAEAIVHIDASGAVSGFTDGFARGIVADVRPVIDLATAFSTAMTRVPSSLRLSSKGDLQFLRRFGRDRLTYRIQLEYEHGGEIFQPIVFVDAHDGVVAWSYDNLRAARDRRVYSANHGTSLPGTLRRLEGGPATGDADIDGSYDRVGSTYDCYQALFGRDSYDNAGAALISSVHYSNNYSNGFWNGAQLVFGDGDNVNTNSYALSMDMTAHELTHGVIEWTSNLIYSGESGGLNEATSDIFGNVCEWYRDTGGDVNGPTSANTWMVYEGVLLAAPALRYMDDPARDGASADFWSPSVGNIDVHYSSGIANLAFYLVANGGTHPRGKSTTVVSGIGIHDASRIFYLANTAYLTQSATFADARVSTIAAAVDLFGPGSNQVVQIGNAWSAVGVLTPVPPGTVLAQTDFETNLGSFTVGGVDAERIRNTNFSSSGRYSVGLRDDTGAAASIFSTIGLAVASYTTLRIEYNALTIGMERDEGYVVEIQRDNGGWEIIADLVVGTDFIDNVRHAGDWRVPLAGASTVTVRFRCDASDDSDRVYLDDITLSAR